jgi:hypothetical protein
LCASPQARALERQRCGILRQAHFITTSEKGVSERSWVEQTKNDTERELPRCQEDSLKIPERLGTIHCHIRQMKALDIFPKRSILKFIPSQFSIPVNFQQNRNLPEMAMKTRHPKVLKVMPPKEQCSFPDVFSFGR